MADFNLEALSLKELQQLQKDLAKAISTYEDRQKAEARAKLDAIAKEMGYSLADLMGVEVKTTRAPAAAKYRHPENTTLTWSGRGRKPQRARPSPARTRALWRSESNAVKCRVNLGLTARPQKTRTLPHRTSDPSRGSANWAQARDLADVL